MATVLEPFDTPMLDYHADTDVQMHTNSDPWFHDEAIMEEDSLFPLTRSSSDADLVDVEIEMGHYPDNPEYEMVDETTDYPADVEPEDVVVTDASHQTHAQEDLIPPSDTAHVPAEMTSASLPASAEAFLPLSSIATETLPITEDAHSSPIFSAETHMHVPDPLSVAVVSLEAISETDPAERATVSDEGVISEPLFVDESTTHTTASALEAVHVSSAADQDPPATSYLEGDSSETTVFTEQTQVEEPLQTEDVQPVAEQAIKLVGTSVAAELISTESGEVVFPEAGTEDQQTEAQEEHGFSESDPHEVSEGVYIDPPPAVFLSFAFLEHSEVCLFNQPPHSSPSSSTTELSSYAVILSDQPTLYYEPLSAVFDALRHDNELSSMADLSHVELVLDAYDLQLTVSEDNLFAREVSLHDLNVLHDGSDLSGPLRLRLHSVNPRFIVRYRILQDQIQRLNLVEPGEEYNVDELNNGLIQDTTEQEHGPDYTEEEYTQDQEADDNQKEHAETASTTEAQLDPTNEDDTEPTSNDAVVADGGDTLLQDQIDANQDREVDEGVEVTGSFEEDQQYAEEENYEASEEISADPPVVDGDDLHSLPDNSAAAEGHEQDPDAIQEPNDEAPENQESHELEDDKQSESVDNVETVTVIDASSELYLPEAGPHGTEESYPGDDLYYDEDADAEWDGTEYDEIAIGEEGANTTFDTEAEPELDTASVESSVTLSSRNSKRSIDDVDDENTPAVASVQSSPVGSKRARTE